MKTQIRNYGHIILGFFFWNYIGYLTGLSAMNLTAGNIVGITLATLVFGTVLGGTYEWLQKVLAGSNFDYFDILRTVVGFSLAAVVFTVFPQFKSLLMFIVSIVLVLADLSLMVYRFIQKRKR